MAEISERKKALVDLAVQQVGIHEEGGDNSGPLVEMYQRVMGKPHKEPWCVSFVQWCVREIDKKFNSKTVLFATESSQMLWLKSPETSRVQVPEPGSIVIWTSFNQNNLPLSTGHVGIVREILDSEWMLTVEGNTSPTADLDSIVRNGDGSLPDGVYLKKRRLRATTGPLRTTGFLAAW
jgi:hypothetical protein